MNNYAIAINKHDLTLIECEYSNDFHKSEKQLKKNDMLLQYALIYLINLIF